MSKSGAKRNGQKKSLLCQKEQWSEKKDAKYLAYFVAKSTGSKKEAKYLAIRDRRSQKTKS